MNVKGISLAYNSHLRWQFERLDMNDVMNLQFVKIITPW